jgi:hypothetical protein
MHAGRPVSSPCLLRQVSSVGVTQSWEPGSPHLDDAQFVTANFMAAELQALSGKVSLPAIKRWDRIPRYRYLVHKEFRRLSCRKTLQT